MREISISVLSGNAMRLDGGSMFGNAPKALWSRWMPADERNMIDIGSNCLLIRTRNHNILFETGAGAYLAPEMKTRFQIREARHVLLDSLAEKGLRHQDITHLVLSHLHFDHAGGLLAAWDESREGLGLLFPNAQFIVGAENFQRSLSPHPRDRASFIPELAPLLQKTGRLSLQREGGGLSLDGVEIRFSESQGHTPGMLVSWIRAGEAELVFTGDLVPAHPWINPPVTMGFDRFPEGLINEKIRLLERAMEAGALLVYPHDPQYAASRLGYDSRTNRVVAADHLPRLEMTV